MALVCFKMRIAWHGGTLVTLEHNGMEIVLGGRSSLWQKYDQASVIVANQPLPREETPVSDGRLLIHVPGEYEHSGFLFRVAASHSSKDPWNNVTLLINQNIRLCHLGAMTDPALPENLLDEIALLNVLFVPLGVEKGLSLKQAVRVIHELTPQIVIPLWLDKDGQEQNELNEQFKKEMGNKIETATTYTLQKRDLEPSEQTRAVVLKKS